MIGCFDIDFILFEAASVAETKFITATHKPTGKVMEFENRTELWGDWRKKNGGWIGVQNKMSGSDVYKAEDFEVVDGQRPRPFKTKLVDEEGNEIDGYLSPLEGAKKIVDDRIKSICDKYGFTSYHGYTGEGEVFRHKVATLLPYKGNRTDLLSPLALKALKQYVIDKHHIELVTEIEADDAVAIAVTEGYKRWKAMDKDDKFKTVGVAVDKDSKGVEGFWVNPDKDPVPRCTAGFGKLFLNDKGDVDGYGRMFLYWQTAHGDDTDHYKANCFSSIKYGGKGAYNDLVDCKDDKEAWTKLVEIFKRLYPEPVEVEGCKGKITIDWLHVLREMFTMARMIRFRGDAVDAKDVLDKLGVEYE